MVKTLAQVEIETEGLVRTETLWIGGCSRSELLLGDILRRDEGTHVFVEFPNQQLPGLEHREVTLHQGTDGIVLVFN